MGEQRIINGAIYEKTPNGIVLVGPAPSAGPAMPTAVPLPVNPVTAARQAQDDARKAEDQAMQRLAAERAAAAANRQADAADRTASNQSVDNAMKLRGAYEAMPIVKEYRVGINQLGAALTRSEDATGDNALIYDYAKAMDPGSVVRESEMSMASSGAPAYEAAVANLKKQFKLEGGGQLTPETRSRLKREIANKVASMNKQYSAQRIRYAEDAKKFGIDPRSITGDHDGDVFMPQIKEYGSQQHADNELPDPTTGAKTKPPSDMRDLAVGDVDPETGATYMGDIEGGQPYDESAVSQGLSGINEGLAGIAGVPVDLVTGALNLGSRGINAIANTSIPTIENPTLGSQWIKDQLGGAGAIAAPSNDRTSQIVRRMGESIGASAIPLGGAATTMPRFLAQLGVGAGGGAGAATAQQVFPGNPLAEIAGEIMGGGAAGYGALRGAQRASQREIEKAIPSVEQLKQQASNLYRQAETRGVAAGPTQTQQLADDLRQTLRSEGQLGPNGKITDADTNTSKAFNLIEQYAGGQMRPTEMDTIRKVIGDSRKSPDASDQRLGKILLDQFDDWVRPLAPDFDEARAVSSRYLQAEDLEEARALAEAGNSKFTASGMENALRNEYRALDKASVRGKTWFSPDVQDAIQKVNRGTPASNIARGLGRFAPSGPLSMTAAGAPVLAGGMFAGPVGAAAGATLGVAGMAGRKAATEMGLRNAQIAELTARNGGPIPQAPLIPAAFKDLAAQIAAIQQAKYLTER